MWPWEHLAFGYLCYSLGRRVAVRRSSSDRAAVALAVGTQLPDLVDKPLAWGLGVLPNGTTMAHSLLFAVPLVAAVVALARRRGVADAGTAFAVGYLSHLLGDVLYPLLAGGEVVLGFLLWPLVERPPGSVDLLGTVGRLWASFVAFLGTPRGRLYLLGEVLLLGSALLLWLADGAPGLPRRRTT